MKILIVLFILLLAACKSDPLQTGEPSPYVIGGAGVSRVVSINQNWDRRTQEKFWSTGQGSKIMPYKWYLHLEQANSEKLFNSPENILKYGFIPQHASRWNQDGLPVGFAASDLKDGAWLGLTCAACHSAQLNYQGIGLIIDGAPTQADVVSFNHDIAAALKQTLDDDHKFSRFALAVLGERNSQKTALKEELKRVTDVRLSYNERNKTPVEGGHGRVDAFGFIFNQIAAGALNMPENIKPPNAPVSYPFLWGTPQSDVVQWDGSAANYPPGLGPLGRNTGEVLGVFGTIDIKPKKVFTGYKSSVLINELGKLEKWVQSLRSPQWPEKLLPPLDQQAVLAGEKIYHREGCIKCHKIINRANQGLAYEAKMIELDVIGTDRTTAENIAYSRSKTGPLQGEKIVFFKKERFGPEVETSSLVTNAVIGAIAYKPFSTLEAVLRDYFRVNKEKATDKLAYKARPLTGIWATAPYLHNGSVPNLYQLLLPPEKRVKEFYVGSREFDPRLVGYDSSSGPFRFDTGFKGNYNIGHNFGTSISEEERWQLIEYLKSL